MPTWNEEHLAVVLKGADAIAAWRDAHRDETLVLTGADLSRADLQDADLSRADLQDADLGDANLYGAGLSRANLYGAGLSRANLYGAGLSRANLSYADLLRADLSRANLDGADLNGAKLILADLISAKLNGAKLTGAVLSHADLLRADLSGATLTGANLRQANLRQANLREAYLTHANLTGADLRQANLSGADLKGVDFARAKFAGTTLDNCALSLANGLATAVHHGPSVVDITVLRDLATLGYVPWVDDFLRGCGYSKWEVRNARLHDPHLEDHEIAGLVDEIYGLRSAGPLVVGGTFISYSGEDSFALADRIYETFRERGTPCWLDKHSIVAGKISKQLQRAIRLHDNVILILSEAALKSTWVNSEITRAHEKAADQGRDVLCPIAIDDSWKSPPAGSLLREDLLTYLTGSYHILDFSDWENSFDESFEKLWKGLRIFFERPK